MGTLLSWVSLLLSRFALVFQFAFSGVRFDFFVPCIRRFQIVLTRWLYFLDLLVSFFAVAKLAYWFCLYLASTARQSTMMGHLEHLSVYPMAGEVLSHGYLTILGFWSLTTIYV